MPQPEGARLIDAVIAGTWIDPDKGTAAHVGIKHVAIEKSLAGMEADLIRRLGFGRNLAVVSDPATHDVMGRRVAKAVASVGPTLLLEFPDPPHADAETVERVRLATQGADALIAVGSGTINDLCKMASFKDGKPYAVFGTAPSMNGFTSANAAITVAGQKLSLPSHEPEGVFLDLTVLAGAPKRLIRAGLGDSLCRATAQADWLLAHELRGLPFRQGPFDLLAPDEEGLVAEPEALVAGDIDAMARLARTLVLSGLGMTICGSSHPASQGEHLISHYSEMMPMEGAPKSFHGEQIAVTTLVMARLMERVLAGKAPEVKATRHTERDFMDHFGADLGSGCWQHFEPKVLDHAAAGNMSATLAARWPRIVQRISAVLRSEAEIKRAYARAGAPVTAGDIGWSDDYLRTATTHARKIRDRFGFLDLADDAGIALC